jgi:hypothetical protein
MDGDSTELNRMSSVGAEVKLDPLRKFRPASQGEPNGRAAWFPSLREGDLQEGGSSFLTFPHPYPLNNKTPIGYPSCYDTTETL